MLTILLGWNKLVGFAGRLDDPESNFFCLKAEKPNSNAKILNPKP